MPKTPSRLHDKTSVAAHLDKINREREKTNQLPVHYDFEDDALMLLGTNNLGECDEHNVLRLEGMTLEYKGPVHVRAHLSDTALRTVGKEHDIRLSGYVSGTSDEKPARIVAEKAAVMLGDPNHPERKMVVFAHIEAGDGVNIYKRQLVNSTILNRDNDTVIRGQNIQNVFIESPSVNINTSICKNTTIHTIGDAMLKGSEYTGCVIKAENGDVYLCAGTIRHCVIEAKYDIELNGHVDEFTLQNARSAQGKIRRDGEVIAMKRSAAAKVPPKKSKRVVALPRKTAKAKRA